ncbi:MAG: type II toxin-antitoxin system Phd/YefM family antitoxin [Candidatus Omnitrophica bacterium]|nr:type II toxin-antitoxin system Phd/YefM family antitoxin [Candidatus Omnitrophota bacterium]
MINTVSLKELRPELPRVIENIDSKLDRYVITKHGKPVVVMLSIDDYESLMETLDILADPDAMAGFKQGERDIKEGQTRSWKEIKKDLGKL